MISVLLPSRLRPAQLAESCLSLMGHASRPDQVEILVARDPDDDGPIPAVVSTVWTAPERYGYLGLHHYVNKLATLASGEWLLLWNDDARMKTPGWDAIIEQQPQGVLWLQANHVHNCNIFPAWPKKWTDMVGHVALCWNNDTWIQMLGEQLRRQWAIPVDVFHDRADVTGNNQDATAAEGYQIAYGNGNNKFWDADMRAARDADVRKLQEIL